MENETLWLNSQGTSGWYLETLHLCAIFAIKYLSKKNFYYLYAAYRPVIFYPSSWWMTRESRQPPWRKCFVARKFCWFYSRLLLKIFFSAARPKKPRESTICTRTPRTVTDSCLTSLPCTFLFFIAFIVSHTLQPASVEIEGKRNKFLGFTSITSQAMLCNVISLDAFMFVLHISALSRIKHES